MESNTISAADQQSLGRLKLLVGLAVVAALTAAVAGLLLLIMEPDAGSNTEAVLGLMAAIGGLATGALAIVAVIYAQVKSLWRFAPMPFRIVLWLFIVAGVAVTIWSLVSAPFQN